MSVRNVFPDLWEKQKLGGSVQTLTSLMIAVRTLRSCPVPRLVQRSLRITVLLNPSLAAEKFLLLLNLSR